MWTIRPLGFGPMQTDGKCETKGSRSDLIHGLEYEQNMKTGRGRRSG